MPMTRMSKNPLSPSQGPSYSTATILTYSLNYVTPTKSREGREATAAFTQEYWTREEHTARFNHTTG